MNLSMQARISVSDIVHQAKVCSYECFIIYVISGTLITSGNIVYYPIQGDAFVICAEFQKLETIHNWVYDGCSKCSAKLKDDDDGVLICPLCKKKPKAVEPKWVDS